MTKNECVERSRQHLRERDALPLMPVLQALIDTLDAVGLFDDSFTRWDRKPADKGKWVQ